MSLPGSDLLVGLREDPERAAVMVDADPFALRTSVAELTSWITHLDGLGIGHSPIIKASSGYGLGFLTPDGMQIRLYAEDDAVRAENVDSDGTVHLSRMTLDEVRPGES